MSSPSSATASRAEFEIRKGRGKEVRLSYQGNVLTENRNGLIVGDEVVIGEGAAETEGALRLLESVPAHHRVTVGADKLYDSRSFVEGARPSTRRRI